MAKSLLPKGAAEEAHKYIMKSKTLPQLLQHRLGLRRFSLTERVPFDWWCAHSYLPRPLFYFPPAPCNHRLACKRAEQHQQSRWQQKLSNALPFPALPFARLAPHATVAAGALGARQGPPIAHLLHSACSSTQFNKSCVHLI